MPGQVNAQLIRFIVYNPSFGPREGEEEKKIIYYYPPDDDLRTQCKNTGFAVACTNFSKIFFGPERSCKSVHTQKTKSVFLQPEEGFWMHLVVSLPHTKRKNKAGNADIVEYNTEEVQETLLQSLLQHSYEMFKFFMNSFEFILNEECDGEKDLFKSRVSHFFEKFVPTLKHEKTSILDLFRAIQFLTLVNSQFLKVENFVNMVRNEFPMVTKIVIFQERNVVWTELQQNDTKMLYHYITSSLFVSGNFKADSISRGPFSGHQGRFIAGGPPVLKQSSFDELDAALPLKVFLQSDATSDDPHEHQLVIYHAVSSTVCLFFPAFSEATAEFYCNIDAILGPRLTNMSADLLDVFNPKLSTSSSYSNLKAAIPRTVSSTAIDTTNSARFLYFNHFNCAMKSTLQLDGNLAPEVLKLMVEQSSDFDKNARCDDNCIPIEIFAKMQNEQWVISKSVDKRKVFVIITAKCATLMEANDEFQRLISTEFKNVYI